MSFRRAEGAFAVLIAIGSLGCAAFAAGQTAEILPVAFGTGAGISDDGMVVVGQDSAPSWSEAFRWKDGNLRGLGSLSDDVSGSYAYGASADGSVVAGWTNFDPGFGWPERAFRWQKSTVPGTETGVMSAMGAAGDNGSTSFGYDISDDGRIIVGKAEFAPDNVVRAVSWTNGSLRDLGPRNEPQSESVAWGVSGDGKIIVGQCRTESTVPHAFRWTVETGMVDIGSLNTPLESSIANAISRSGEVIVGKSGNRAFIKRGDQPMELLTGFTTNGSAEAFDVSYDGRVVVGVINGSAGLWIDGQPRSLEDVLAADFGVDVDSQWWSLQNLKACSADGRYVVGTGYHRTLSGSVVFRAYLPLPNRAPTVTSDHIPAGSTIQVKLGQTFQTVFEGRDPDLDTITMTENMPVGTFNPTNGNAKPSPFDVNFAFTPVLSNVGSHSGTVKFTDTSGDSSTESGQIDFTIVVPPNSVPTVAPIAAKTIECNGEHNLITLTANVADADGHPLKVDWFVGGVRKQTTSGVMTGATTFKYDFPHGVSNVAVQVSDAYSPVQQQGTTVTVQDTTAPVVIVAPTLIVPTDPGVSYATKPRLPKPQVNEKCDGDPTLINDAPPILPIGQYTVTWTATDFTGLSMSATQTIIVKDLEKPEMIVSAAVSKRVDRGQIYATIPLAKPQVFDNVTPGSKIVVKSNARPQYPIGTTVVTWTATDEAGNVGKATTKVTVVNQRPTANAGPNLVVNTKSEKGAKVRLNGSKSSDPDGHELKYFWSARGVKFGDPKSKTPQGTFKVGVTNVTLTVTDEGGVKHTDTVKVTVRLKGGSARSQGAAANEAFGIASSTAAQSVKTGDTGDASVAGYRYAAAADRFGLAAGEYVLWDDGQTEQDGLASYAELRYYQTIYGARATNELIRAFGETGSDSALHAALEAARGVQAARADLSE